MLNACPGSTGAGRGGTWEEGAVGRCLGWRHSSSLLLQAWPPDLLGPLTALNKHALDV